MTPHVIGVTINQRDDFTEWRSHGVLRDRHIFYMKKDDKNCHYVLTKIVITGECGPKFSKWIVAIFWMLKMDEILLS